MRNTPHLRIRQKSKREGGWRAGKQVREARERERGFWWQGDGQHIDANPAGLGYIRVFTTRTDPGAKNTARPDRIDRQLGDAGTATGSECTALDRGELGASSRVLSFAISRDRPHSGSGRAAVMSTPCPLFPIWWPGRPNTNLARFDGIIIARLYAGDANVWRARPNSLRT